MRREKGSNVGTGVGSRDVKTHRRVPRMNSSMDPTALDWLGLGTRGRRVRGGGFLRRADCAGRDSEEELCSRGRRGRGLLEGTALDPGLWDARSSGSLSGKEESKTRSMNSLFATSQLAEDSAKQGVRTRDKNTAWMMLCTSCSAKCVFQ